MKTIKERSPDIQRRIEKTKAEARKDVIKRGIMHFRADEEMMEQLLEVAAYKKLPTGSMVRSWVAERLRKEYTSLSGPRTCKAGKLWRLPQAPC